MRRLGIFAVVSILVLGLIAVTPVSDAITELVKTKIKLDDDEYEKITFKLAEKVPTDGSVFGGYAVFTEGHTIAVTSHVGAFDSEVQEFPDEDATFGLCDASQIADGFCGADWHSHLVEGVGNENCGFAAVGALTFEEPSDELDIKAKKIILEEIEMETEEFTESITGEERDFTAGAPTSGGVAFDLNPVFTNAGGLVAICIGDIADDDADGVANGVDNCPDDANPDQADSNGNGVGDACEVVLEPSIEPTSGLNGSPFTIIDPQGRIQAGDIVVFTEVGSSPETGSLATNVVINPDGTSATGNVPLTIGGGEKFVTVHDNVSNPPRFSAITYSVT